MTQDEKDLKELHTAVCNGNVAAEEFCNLWFEMCHGIDDLIDSREDGRPTMTPEQILRIFMTVMAAYNAPFYVTHRDKLHPIAFGIHNMYADVVAFEKAPEPEKRVIADVVRCCGNEMYHMVAAICGGYAHMRRLSPVIRHRSWILQHDPKAQQF